MFTVAVLIANLVAIGLAEVGEKHHRKLAKAMNSKINTRQRQAVTTS